MSTIDDETGEEARSFGDRVAAAANATASLARTRLAIFKEELSVKAVFAAKGLGAAAAAGAFAVAMILMLGALLVALFAALFHSLILGILAALVFNGAVAGGLGWMAWRALSQVKLDDFPATSAELAKDVAAVKSALERDDTPDDDFVPPEPDSGSVEDLERRLRAGAE
jgi:Putative Actinobacterial Holin-X, holin superfamily III